MLRKAHIISVLQCLARFLYTHWSKVRYHSMLRYTYQKMEIKFVHRAYNYLHLDSTFCGGSIIPKTVTYTL